MDGETLHRLSKPAWASEVVCSKVQRDMQQKASDQTLRVEISACGVRLGGPHLFSDPILHLADLNPFASRGVWRSCHVSTRLSAAVLAVHVDSSEPVAVSGRGCH